jgi:hypothetical protein
MALVRTDISEELSTSFIRVTVPSSLILVVTNNGRTLRSNTNMYLVHSVQTAPGSNQAIILGNGSIERGSSFTSV